MRHSPSIEAWPATGVLSDSDWVRVSFIRGRIRKIGFFHVSGFGFVEKSNCINVNMFQFLLAVSFL